MLVNKCYFDFYPVIFYSNAFRKTIQLFRADFLNCEIILQTSSFIKIIIESHLNANQELMTLNSLQ